MCMIMFRMVTFAACWYQFILLCSWFHCFMYVFVQGVGKAGHGTQRHRLPLCFPYYHFQQQYTATLHLRYLRPQPFRPLLWLWFSGVRQILWLLFQHCLTTCWSLLYSSYSCQPEYSLSNCVPTLIVIKTVNSADFQKIWAGLWIWLTVVSNEDKIGDVETLRTLWVTYTWTEKLEFPWCVCCCYCCSV